jgi:Phosphotransferase enzyme family
VTKPEIPLAGGDVNVVVRVGDTVRRPLGPAGVQALLRWYEQVGFAGAPRFIGIDDRGREVLSFVEGEPAFAPVPGGDDVVAEIGRLLRRAHDAQAGFVPPPDAAWQRHEADPGAGEVIGHGDLFWTNVIFRDGLPAALIDWELARPTTRVLDVALAATYWAGVRIDDQLVEWGLPLDRRGERLRILCDAYGLEGDGRSRLLDELVEHRRRRVDQGAWRGATPRHVILANLRWVEDHRSELARFLA